MSIAPKNHDDGEKTFLGHTGNFDGQDIIDIVVNQPATARFLARHLYNFFVADEPQVPSWNITPPNDPDAIDQLIAAYDESDGDIRAMLRVLFNSDFFKQAQFSRVKSPAELVVSTARLAGNFSGPRPGFNALAFECAYQGQELLNPPSVESWHTGSEWIDGGALVRRGQLRRRPAGRCFHARRTLHGAEPARARRAASGRIGGPPAWNWSARWKSATAPAPNCWTRRAATANCAGTPRPTPPHPRNASA